MIGQGKGIENDEQSDANGKAEDGYNSSSPLVVEFFNNVTQMH
jgi:hypothetical protein